MRHSLAELIALIQQNGGPVNISAEPAAAQDYRPRGLLLDWDAVGQPEHAGSSVPARGLLQWMDHLDDLASENAMAPELRRKPTPDELLNLPPIWYPSPLDATEEQIHVLREMLQRPDLDGQSKDRIRLYIEDYEKRQDRLLRPGEGMDYERRFYQWHEDISPEDWEERKRQEEQRQKDRIFDRG